ncbi:MAG: lipase family protein [Rhodococcus sp. (in: high G+C Gram-positive bacteria)]
MSEERAMPYCRKTRALIVLATVLGLTGALVGPVATAAPVAVSDFYGPPAPLPLAAPGTVIRTELSVDAVIPGTGALVDAHATRVMYVSRDVQDQPTAVTGTLLVPTMPWTGVGPRPLVAFGPGTQGLGDQCAPSKLMTFGQEYENLQIGPLLALGYSVAVTDYQGLGTPGVHPYLNRVAGGRALLDMARAARSMDEHGVSPDAPLALWGYSQGGQASGAAAELASTYAPELTFVGAFAGSPAPDLTDLADFGDQSILSGGIGWVVAGLIAAYPDHAGELLSIFNPAGLEILDRSQNYCVYDALQMNPFGSTTAYTKDGRPISAYMHTEPLASLVAAQRLGTLRPAMPVFVGQNRGDDLVAARGTVRLQQEWCDMGVRVQSLNLDVPQILPKTALGHVIGLVTVFPALQWLKDRFDGVAAPSNC